MNDFEDTTGSEPAQNAPEAQAEGAGADPIKEAEPVGRQRVFGQPGQPQPPEAETRLTSYTWRLTKTLDAIVSRAPALRSAGVTRVSVQGVEFDIAEEVPPAAEGLGDDAHDDIDPLSDPDTFGGFVPSLRARRPQ